MIPDILPLQIIGMTSFGVLYFSMVTLLHGLNCRGLSVLTTTKTNVIWAISQKARW